MFVPHRVPAKYTYYVEAETPRYLRYYHDEVLVIVIGWLLRLRETHKTARLRPLDFLISPRSKLPVPSFNSISILFGRDFLEYEKAINLFTNEQRRATYYTYVSRK